MIFGMYARRDDVAEWCTENLHRRYWIGDTHGGGDGHDFFDVTVTGKNDMVLFKLAWSDAISWHRTRRQMREEMEAMYAALPPETRRQIEEARERRKVARSRRRMRT